MQEQRIQTYKLSSFFTFHSLTFLFYFECESERDGWDGWDGMGWMDRHHIVCQSVITQCTRSYSAHGTTLGHWDMHWARKCETESRGRRAETERTRQIFCFSFSFFLLALPLSLAS